MRWLNNNRWLQAKREVSAPPIRALASWFV